MQFGWVSNTHSLSHATKLRKKSHEEIQLTTKTKTQIKALECFLQEICLEIKPLHDDSNNKENLKNKWRLIQIPYSFSSNKCIRNPLTVLQFTFKANYTRNQGKSPIIHKKQINFGIQSHTKIKLGYLYKNLYQTKYQISQKQSKIKPIRSLRHK